MSSLDQLAAGALVRARPWDVAGAAFGAPMVLWGFLGWFGTVGDSGGGMSGFYSGTGAAGIGLVLAASAATVHLLLAGRPHRAEAPPVGALLAGGRGDRGARRHDHQAGQRHRPGRARWRAC